MDDACRGQWLGAVNSEGKKRNWGVIGRGVDIYMYARIDVPGYAAPPTATMAHRSSPLESEHCRR
jgi:hypothetical protein